MELKFTGNITEISEIKTGESNGKPWASLDFEVTESNPQNANYPQVGNFGFFKNGDYTKYASEFNNNFKLGDEVEVEFNLKCVKYQKDGEERKFYKTECWKVTKVGGSQAHQDAFEPAGDLNEDEPDDLPF